MTPVAPEEMLGERIGDRFVIERLIGEGPVSSAYRARDELLTRRVTVKLFHPTHPDDATVVESQLSLAHAVARLSHPNIVTVIDRGEHQGMPFVVLEYVRGESLEERIDRYAPLEVEEAASVACSVAEALAYAHERDVTHGNLRPRNVLVSLDLEVKLVDFGGGSYIAQLGSGDSYRLPDASGRVAEIEPDGPPAVLPSHDVYALGCLLFEALTAERPVPDADPGYVQMLRPDLPAQLAEVVSRLLSTDPSFQYSSMGEAAALLAQARPVRRRGAAAGGGVTPAAVAGALPAADEMAPLVPDDGAMQAGRTQIVPALDRDTGLTGEIEQPTWRRRHQRRSQRARWIVWGALVGPLLLLGLFVALLGGEFGTGQQEARDERPAGDDPLAAASVAAFDPAPGDGRENDAAMHLVVDGDPSTTWETEGYETEDLSGIKDGVGLQVTLEEPGEAAELRVISDLQGWQMQVFASDGEAATVDEMQSVSSSVTVDKQDVRIPLDTDGDQHHTYVVWITSLTRDVDRFRARIGELEIRGA